MTHLLAATAFWSHDIWHPLRGDGYQFWSGVGSDLSEVTLIGVLLGAWRHVNCEEPWCFRPGHRHPDHGRPVCRKHYHSERIAPDADGSR